MEKNRLLESFKSAAGNGKLSHAYILEGPKSSEKKELAYRFAESLTPYHEDITIVSVDGRSVRDEAVEGLQERLSLKPMVGDLNVGIIEDADTMTVRAQNRLLKTLEEPPGGAVILLLSENRSNLLPTILSRCVVRRVDEEGPSAEAMPDEVEKQAACAGEMLLGNSSFYSLAGIMDAVSKERDTALQFLDALEEWYREVILSAAVSMPQKGLWSEDGRMADWISEAEPQKGYRAVALIEEARNDILRNVNSGYTLKNLVLKIQQSS